VQLGLDVDSLKLPQHYHAYCLWEPQLSDLQEADDTKKRLIWRAAEPPLGYGRQEPLSANASLYARHDCKDANILVVDDAGLDFRTQPLQIDGPEWIVLKLSGNIGEGKLWQSLSAAKPSNLVILISADQLRRSDIHLGRALSWEATVQDLMRELDNNPVLYPLKLARHLVVSFRSDGAFWMSRPCAGDSSSLPCSLLVFDGARAEGEWQIETGSGVVFGYLSCFAAAIVHHLCALLSSANIYPKAETAKLDPETVLTAGLGASRQLYRLGHGDVMVKNPANSDKTIPNPKPGFPASEIAEAIRQPTEKFASTLLSADVSSRGDWMMLDEWHVHAKQAFLRRPFFDAAFAVAVLGPGALERFPVARFRELRSVDRGEIEGLRIVRQAMQAYRDGGPQKKL
jgi:hypothetical protein